MPELFYLYVWTAVVTAIAVARPDEPDPWQEWIAAILAGALWPLLVAVRLTRWLQRLLRERM
jgi:hypothetical protein